MLGRLLDLMASLDKSTGPVSWRWLRSGLTFQPVTSPSSCLCALENRLRRASAKTPHFRPVALTPIITNCFKRLVLAHLKTSLPPTPDPFQFAYPRTGVQKMSCPLCFTPLSPVLYLHMVQTPLESLQMIQWCNNDETWLSTLRRPKSPICSNGTEVERLCSKVQTAFRCLCTLHSDNKV